MKQTKAELNELFDSEPSDYEVSEFMIFRDGVLDRSELIKARLSRFGTAAGHIAFEGVKVVAMGALEVLEAVAEEGRRVDIAHGVRSE